MKYTDPKILADDIHRGYVSGKGFKVAANIKVLISALEILKKDGRIHDKVKKSTKE